MRLLQADDPDALEELYARHRGKLTGRARVLCDTDEAAEEAVQDTFVSLWRSRAAFDHDRGSIQTWLFALLQNRSIDVYRRDRRYDAQRDSDAELPGVTAPGCLEDEAVARDEADRLRASIARLPPSQCEVVTLAFFGELSHREIAEHLDVPLGTVKGRLRLGLLKVRTDVDFDTPAHTQPVAAPSAADRSPAAVAETPARSAA